MSSQLRLFSQPPLSLRPEAGSQRHQGPEVHVSKGCQCRASFLCFHWRGSQLTLDPLTAVTEGSFYVILIHQVLLHSKITMFHLIVQNINNIFAKSSKVEAFLYVHKIYMFFSVTFQNGQSNLCARKVKSKTKLTDQSSKAEEFHVVCATP